MSAVNHLVLNEFVDLNEIERDDFGRCRFRANVIIKASGWALIWSMHALAL